MSAAAFAILALSACAAPPPLVLHEPGITASRCHVLIERLASDVSPDEKDAIIRELKSMGKGAMPCLIEHWGDDRYCLDSISPWSSKGDFRTSVGDVMVGLFFVDLLGLFPVHVPEPAAWWEENRNRTFDEMRVDLERRRRPLPKGPGK